MADDVRSIANLVLEIARNRSVTLTNLSINKLVYFTHAHYLAITGKPLVSAKIEAWQYGPVFRELYQEFKKYGSESISEKIKRIDPKTGRKIVCHHVLSEDELDIVTSEIKRYLKLSPSKLVRISHEPGAPWDKVWNHDKRTNPTMRISDEMILRHFKEARRH